MPSEIGTSGIDMDAYAPGSVRRYNQQYGAWVLRCEEIARLHQRFCDLTATGQGQGFTVSLTVTTDDNGVPAGILRLPFGVLLSAPLTVSTQDAPPPAAGKKAPRPQSASDVSKLQLLTCGKNDCATVWPFSKGQLAALAAGRNLHVRFAALKPVSIWATALPWPQTVPLAAVIPGAGFAAALNASQAASPR